MAEYDRKNCPLKFHTDALSVSTYPCDEKKCAWWDDFTGHCAILSISRHGSKGSFDIVKKERKGE